MQFVQHQPRTHTLRHTRAHTRHSHWVQISLLNNFAATWSWSWHELGLRLVSCLVWSLGSVCSVSLCPFLCFWLSVSRSVAKLASNSCQKRRRKLRPNQMDLLVSEIKPRNETKWVNCGFKFSQLLGCCCCCCCLPPSIANHIHKPHTTAHPHTHTHSAWWPVCCLGNAFLFAIFCNLFAKPLWLLKFLTHAAYFWGPVAGADRVARVMLLHGTLLKHLIDFCTRTATAKSTQPKSFSLLITGGRGREANFLIALKSLCVAVKYIAYTTRHLPFMHAHARTLAHTHTHTPGVV